MRYRTLGRTGLEVSVLSMGTVELGLDYGIGPSEKVSRPREAEAIRLVHAALDMGVNFFDTARAYGDSERVLGLALKGRRTEVVLATKVDPRRPDRGLWPDGEIQHFMLASLETSLRKLRTDYVDIWMIHSIDEAMWSQREPIAEALAEARRRGLVRWTGASFYGTTLPAEALSYDIFDVIQVAYSVLDQRMDARVFPLARAHDVGVVVRSILLKGALTERAESLPPHLEPLRERSRRFRELLAATRGGMTPAQGAIAFGLANLAIHTVLVGVRTEAELAEDVAAVDMQLTSAELAILQSLTIEDDVLLDPGAWNIP